MCLCFFFSTFKFFIFFKVRPFYVIRLLRKYKNSFYHVSKCFSLDEDKSLKDGSSDVDLMIVDYNLFYRKYMTCFHFKECKYIDSIEIVVLFSFF